MNNKQEKANSKLLASFVWAWPEIRRKACATCLERKGVPIYWGNGVVTHDQTIDPCPRCAITKGEEIMMKVLGYRKIKEERAHA